MTRYIAYFDASGTRDIEMIAVGGYISTVDDWKRFDSEWQAALSWGKVPYFHMRRFNAHQTPFKNQKWKREELRSEFLGRLIDAIARNVDWFTLNILPISDWQTVNAEYCMEEERLTPFAVTACGAMLGVEEWCRTHKVPWKEIEVIFEDGDTNKGDFTFWCKNTFYKTPLFKPALRHNDAQPDEYRLTPLQGCDFLAWEARRAETDVKDDPPTYELRKCFAILLDRVRHDGGHEKWNPDNLRRLCIKHGIKKR